MRLLLDIKPQKEEKVIFPYFLQLQGVIYHFLQGTSYQKLHQKKSYKFFCFSNIFSSKENFKVFKKDRLYHWIISSPDKNFLKTLARKFLKKESFNLQKIPFKIEGVRLFKVKLKKRLKLISSTPIILRIPKEKFKEYEISPPREYNYLFWRPQYPFEAFLKQLEANIFKKYKTFYQKEIKEFPIFQRFIFKKSVSIPLKIHGKETLYIGSLWEFHFDFLDKKTKNILEFAIDCGLGEANSKGFGFVNVEKR